MNITSYLGIDLAYWFGVLGMCPLISPVFPFIGYVNHQQDCRTQMACLGDPRLKSWPRDQPFWCVFAQSLQKNPRVLPAIRQ